MRMGDFFFSRRLVTVMEEKWALSLFGKSPINETKDGRRAQLHQTFRGARSWLSSNFWNKMSVMTFNTSKVLQRRECNILQQWPFLPQHSAPAAALAHFQYHSRAATLNALPLSLKKRKSEKKVWENQKALNTVMSDRFSEEEIRH